MIIKTKIFLTVLLGLVYLLFSKTFAIVESPIRGVVTSNQLNDTTSGYMAAQAVQNNYLQTGGLFVSVVLLVLIWAFPVKNKNKNNE